MKICSKCGLSKPLENFCIDRSKPDGRYPSCNECRHADHQVNREKRNAACCAYYQRNAEQLRAYALKYAAEHQDERRAYCQTNRQKQTAKRREWRNRNPGRDAAILRQRYRANPLQKCAELRQWRRNNPERSANLSATGSSRRRARLQGNGIDLVRRAFIIEREHSVCHICGKKVRTKDLTLDHLIPIARGGPDAEWNLAVAHRRCNSSRGVGRLPAQLRLPV